MAWAYIPITWEAEAGVYSKFKLTLTTLHVLSQVFSNKRFQHL